MEYGAIVGISAFIVLVILICIGIPIFISMLVVTLVGYLLVGGYPFLITQLKYAPFAIAENYIFAVIPLFILLGELIVQAGIGTAAFSALKKWVGRLRGGLLMATIGANAVLGAVTSTSITTTVLSMKVAYPELLKANYHKGFCLAGITTAGVLAVLIPPSTPTIVFCILTNVSVGRALIAGIIPGILLTVAYCLTVWLYGKRYPERLPVTDVKETWQGRFFSLKPLWPIIVIFVLLIGGIYLGVFTPTVGGAIGAMAALIYALATRVSKRNIAEAFWNTAVINCTLFPMLVAGFMLSRFTAATGLADYLVDFVLNLHTSPLLVIAIVVLLYILISFPLELLPAMIITLPIFFPLLTGIGFDPFLLVVVLNLLMTLANLTPPTGTSVYLVAALANVNVVEVFRSVIPWFVVTFVYIWILILWPPLTTWLPNLLY
jgi:tripartite ATP-independent transporter DctM subunit